MNEIEVLVSHLALAQLAALPASTGRLIVQGIIRLASFPESAPLMQQRDYEQYRNLIIRDYRAIYRYFEDEQQVRVYCILHLRRRLPPPEFLIYQLF